MALFKDIKQSLFPDDPDKITKSLKDIREVRFASVIAMFIAEAT